MHRKQGRPPRDDWRIGHGLRSIAPNTPILLVYGRKPPGRAHKGRVLRYSAASDHIYLERADGVVRGYRVRSVLKWRPIPSLLKVGDLVGRHDAKDWRGVVRSVIDTGVLEVEIHDGQIELALEGELYAV